MGAEATLRHRRLPVAPGGEASTEITVKNTGLVVDSFTLSVLGEAAPWAFCEPGVISLFPGQEGTAQVLVRLPLESDLPHGPVPFGVRVASGEDPPGSVVEEGVLDVSPLSLVTADMSPRTGRSRGMGASRHRVAVDNRGNAPAVIALAGGDDADTVDVQVKPPELEVPPGSAAFAEVRVRARRRFWRGTAVTHRWHVTTHVPGDVPVTSEGTLLQEAVLPGWLPRALAFGLAGVIAAVALWFAVLRPTVQNAATSAGTVAAQKAVNAALQQPAGTGAAQAGGSGASGAKLASTPSPTPSAGQAKPKTSATPKGPAKPGAAATPKAPSTPGAPATPGTSPTPKSSATTGSGTAASGTTKTTTRPAPVPFALMLDASSPTLTAAAKHTLAITDLVMMNPAGDQGMLTLSRSGQVLFSLQLADFREYDLHFLTAIMINAGQKFQLSVSCQNTGGKTCTPMVMISGTNTAS
jgi:hypothetical protein